MSKYAKRINLSFLRPKYSKYIAKDKYFVFNFIAIIKICRGKKLNFPILTKI